LDDRLPDLAEQVVRMFGDFASGQLLHENELFRVRAGHGKSGGRSRLQSGYFLAHGVLDILRVKIAATNDDQILDPAGHKEFALIEEAEVAGAEVAALRKVGAEGGKSLGGFFGPIPVAFGHAWTSHPNFADLAGGTRQASSRIDDDNVHINQRLSAADHLPRGSPVVSRFGAVGFQSGR